MFFYFHCRNVKALHFFGCPVAEQFNERQQFASAVRQFIFNTGWKFDILMANNQSIIFQFP